MRGHLISLMMVQVALQTAWAQDPCPTTQVITLDGDAWLLATDPDNVGESQAWCQAPRPEAKITRVPWIIQDAFPGYHGIAWYWREVAVPPNPFPNGRTLLRFWAVDYQARIWLNGKSIGQHEGGESPFVLDVTEAVRPGEANLLSVRVLNPTHQPIEGIVLNETPHRNKALPYTSGSAWDQGGIVDSVELLLAPVIRISDLFIRSDWKTGDVQAQVSLVNASSKPAKIGLDWAISPSRSGETLVKAQQNIELPPGETTLDASFHVETPHLWNLDDPFLYQAIATVQAKKHPGLDQCSTRFGFRDFRFSDGAFRLNGKAIYLRCSHTGNCCPIGLEMPHDPDFLRRDLINAKAMRFNMIRFIAGVPKRYQLDLCDDIGLMVYDESYAAWCLGDSPKMAERYDESVLGMIRRDRNHASVTIWGLLNETGDGPVFRHAMSALPKVRELDDSRLVMLGSGRWDRNSGPSASSAKIGSVSNPGSREWENVLDDLHPYKRVPHTPDIIQALRTVEGMGGQPVFLSEYGIGSAVDLLRVVRLYEQAGKPDVEDAQFYRARRDRFLEDWNRWRLSEVFDRPEDFFAQSIERMAGQRLLGLNAIRSNAHVIGHSLTGTLDQGMTAEGLWTTFRELKPGTVDAMFDAWAPLRWCLFAEPVNLYRKGTVKLEAVLANEDVLAPGEYPVRFQVVGPQTTRVWEHTLTVSIPKTDPTQPPRWVIPVLSEDVALDGPPGRYRFLATFERGAAAAGESISFFVEDPGLNPKVDSPVVLWGEDPDLGQWLQSHGVSLVPISSGPQVILAGSKPTSPGGREAFRDLAKRIAAGSVVIFLCPGVFAEGNSPVAWLPLANKGSLGNLPSWLYHKDEWCKNHPFFEGLPSGGLMDYAYYRELIPDAAWIGQDPPQEAVAGGINASQDYSSGLFLSVYRLGQGWFILNTLNIRDNLGRHPAADRLLLNMLQDAASRRKPSSDPPPEGLDQLLTSMGY